jgi:hypothetical protein
MKLTYTLKQLCEALDLPRTRIDAWIARGHFRPAHAPAFGTAREWTITEAIKLAVCAALVDANMPLEQAGPLASSGMHGFKGEAAFYVVWQGWHSTAMKDKTGKYLKAHVPGRWFTEIVKETELLDFLKSDDVDFATVLNLDNIERRVKGALGYTGEG